MSSVPFYVIVTAAGTILAAGNPASVPLDQLAQLLSGDAENALRPHTQQQQHQAPAPQDHPAGSGCVGGVCSLPKRVKKQTVAAEQQESAPSQCSGGVCPLPKREKQTPLPAPADSTPECIGGVCMLPKRVRAPAETQARPPLGALKTAVCTENLSAAVADLTLKVTSAAQQPSSSSSSCLPGSENSSSTGSFVFTLDEDF